MKIVLFLTFLFINAAHGAELTKIDDYQKGKLPALPLQLSGRCVGEKCGGYHDGWHATGHAKVYKKRDLKSDLAFSFKNTESFSVTNQMIEVHKYGRTKVLNSAVCPPYKSGDLIYKIVDESEGWNLYWYKNTFRSCNFAEIPETSPKVSEVAEKVFSEPHYIEWVKVKSKKGLVGWSPDSDDLDNGAY